MFRTVPLSTMRSFSLYTWQWCMSHRFVVSLRAASGLRMIYTIVVFTVKNSWWWREELSKTYRVLFQKWIWGISASSWFYYKNLSRCTVKWKTNKLFTLQDSYSFFLVWTRPHEICTWNKTADYILSHICEENINLLAPELFFFNFSTPAHKMWIIQEPNTLEIWNKLYFEEKKTESIYHV
jgi:hypothetical protein